MSSLPCPILAGGAGLPDRGEAQGPFRCVIFREFVRFLVILALLAGWMLPDFQRWRR